MSQSDIVDIEWGFDEDKKEIEINAPFLFEEIERELGEFLLQQLLEEDSTDGPFDFIENLANRLQEDFDEIIGEDTDKKSFIKSLIRIFALLLNIIVNSVEKIKRILKIDITMMFKLWTGQK